MRVVREGVVKLYDADVPPDVAGDVGLLGRVPAVAHPAPLSA